MREVEIAMAALNLGWSRDTPVQSGTHLAAAAAADAVNSIGFALYYVRL